MALSSKWISSMTPEDKEFYHELGQRIAQYRKAKSLTQTQLAELLGISQQTMAHYECGRLRIAVSMLTRLAEVLEVSIEILVDEQASTTSGKRGPVSLLQRQIEQITLMPRAKQKFISEMLDALIQQQRSA